MTSHDKLAGRCAPFLPAGSQIRQVFIGQSATNFVLIVITYLTGLTMFWIKYRAMAITPDAIYVLESSKPSAGAGVPSEGIRESVRGRGLGSAPAPAPLGCVVMMLRASVRCGGGRG